jgi:ABC-2 type transport system ATP-binding protein
MASGAAVEVESLHKQYPPRWSLNRLRGRERACVALRDVSFAVQPGRVLAIIGPNGSGKSTLLRILGGVLLPTGGCARVTGRDVVRDRPWSRAGVGFASGDDRGLSSRLSVRENARFFGALYGLTGQETARRTAALAERLECAALLDRPVRTLSSGERARASLLRALLHGPKVLLLDEITRSLDPGASARIRARLRDEAAQLGIALVLATHDLREVESTAHQVLLLDGGAVGALGPWAEVRERADAVFARGGEA